jgi:hypothetical protein
VKPTRIVLIATLVIGGFFLALSISDVELRKADLSDTMMKMHELLEVTKADGEYYLYDSGKPGRSWELDQRFNSLISEGSWFRFWVEVHESKPFVFSKYKGKEDFMKKYTYVMNSNHDVAVLEE